MTTGLCQESLLGTQLKKQEKSLYSVQQLREKATSKDLWIVAFFEKGRTWKVTQSQVIDEIDVNLRIVEGPDA